MTGLRISPFLCSGNLLGYVRHNGFIPWDDDIDFALMRDEYERLKAYCRQHIYTVYEYGNKGEMTPDKKHIAKDIEDYYWRDGADCFTVYRPLANGARIRIDFFVLDYYASDYSFDSLMNYAEKVHRRLISDSAPEKKNRMSGKCAAGE